MLLEQNRSEYICGSNGTNQLGSSIGQIERILIGMRLDQDILLMAKGG